MSEEWRAGLGDHQARACLPRRVVAPKSEAEVQRWVRWARERRCGLTVVGGAHTAHCVQPGALALDLRPHFGWARLQADRGAVLLGGGATAERVLAAAAAGGRVCALGTAPTVGAGMMLQGGVGHLSRWRGLTVDSVMAVRCVTADGELRCLDGQGGHELWWAVRGAGPGLAVVTELVLRAFEAGPVWCSKLWAAAGRQQLVEYADLAAECSERESVDLLIRSNGELVASCFQWGPGPTEVHQSMVAVLQPSRQQPPECASALELFGREEYLTAPLPVPDQAPVCFYVRCALLGRPLKAEAAEVLMQAMRAAPTAACTINLQHAGGQAGSEAWDNAFGWRGWEWSAVVCGAWTEQQDGPPVREWVSHTISRLHEHAVGLYAVDLGPQDRQLAPLVFCQSSLDRLRALKAKWDPERVFVNGML